jgi:hypothetical protein
MVRRRNAHSGTHYRERDSRKTLPFREAKRGYRIVVVPRLGGPASEQAPTPDEIPQLFGWTADSHSLLFTEPVGTRWVLFSMPLQGRPQVLFRLERGTISAGLIGSNGSSIGFTLERPDTPPEA